MRLRPIMMSTTMMMIASTGVAPIGAAHAQAASDIVAAANTAARLSPSADYFDGARVIYPYQSGALYELHANPAYVSILLLEPGETINAVASGDTSRWSVTEAEGEAAALPRPVLMIKPQAAGLRTNLVIVTDRRAYVIEARSSTGRAYVAEMAWSYPPAETAAVIAAATLHFEYRVRTRGRAPPWAPRLVFDDGVRTYIDFADGIESADMPPLFIIGAEGVELANYRVQGRRYVVDRLFDAAELRLGVQAPIVVRIERGPMPARRPARLGGRP